MIDRSNAGECLISVDVETAGPNPSDYALLSIGACLVYAPECQFYCELKPVTELLDLQSAAIHGLSMDRLNREGLPAQQAMADFERWVLELAMDGDRPVFVGFNAPFDWMFVADYFHRYLGRNPFGHAALDIKSFAMGALGVPFAETSWGYLSSNYPGVDTIKHNALLDAIDQAGLFRQLLADSDRKP